MTSSTLRALSNLPDLYERQAELVVAVFCPGYETKEWCGLEWNAIYEKARSLRENSAWWYLS